jgi:hypothetical protein
MGTSSLGITSIFGDQCPGLPFPTAEDCPSPPVSRRDIQARPLIKDVTGARTLGTAIAGVVGCGRDPVPSCVDKWYEQG